MIDLISYDKSVFYQNKVFEKSGKYYEKVENIIQSLLECYSCFKENQDTSITYNNYASKATTSSYTKNSKYNKKQCKYQSTNITKPNLIKATFSENKQKNEITCMINENLNKLSNQNCHKIFTKIVLQTNNDNIYTILDVIIKTSIKSKVFVDLYVKLIFTLYAKCCQNVKNVIIAFIEQKIEEIFIRENYEISVDDQENYDDFCERLFDKHIIINKIRNGLLYFQLLYTYNKSRFVANDIFDFLWNLYNESVYNSSSKLNNIYSRDVLLDCLSECFKMHNEIIFEHLETQWMPLIKFDYDYIMELIANIQETSNHYTEYKTKFKAIDLCNQINIYFDLNLPKQ